MENEDKWKAILENETAFLEEGEYPKNEKGVYVFTSHNGGCILSLDFILLEYKQWLIENKIVKEIL